MATRSNQTKGAASAAPRLAELAAEIRAEIVAAEEGHLAHAIRAGELLTEAKGRVAHGEWMPWVEVNFPGHRWTAAAYIRLADPANVGRVSHLTSVREALAAVKKPRAKRTPKPTTEIPETRAKLHDPAVVAWVAKRTRAGMTRDEIERATKNSAHDWPRPGEKLSRVNVSEVQAIAEHERMNRAAGRKPSQESARRLRQLHAERRAGRVGDLWQLQKVIAEAVGVLETFDLPELDWAEETESLIMEISDDLARHSYWNDTATDAVNARMGELARQRRLSTLRSRADDPSSTPGERANAAKAAERLARRLDAERLEMVTT